MRYKLMAFPLSMRFNVRVCDGYSSLCISKIALPPTFCAIARNIIDLNKVLKLITTKLLQWHGIWRYLYAHLLQIIMGKIHHFTKINVQHFSSALLPLEVCQQSIIFSKKVRDFRTQIFSIIFIQKKIRNPKSTNGKVWKWKLQCDVFTRLNAIHQSRGDCSENEKCNGKFHLTWSSKQKKCNFNFGHCIPIYSPQRISRMTTKTETVYNRKTTNE